MAAFLTAAPPALLGLSFLPLGVLVVARLALALIEREPLGSIVWHPVTIAIALVGQVAAIADGVRGR